MRTQAMTRMALILAAALCGTPSQAQPAAAPDIAMVDIAAGEFMMGSEDPKAVRQIPFHKVSIKPFRMGKYEITFAQYDAFAAATGRALPNDEGWGRGDHPVMNVDWADIQAFIGWLNEKTGRRFRLPSEAEWEYTARAGTTTPYWWGVETDLTKMNTIQDKAPDIWPKTSPVGSFPANPFGVHDTSGNLWEWTADCMHPNYEGAPDDGSAWIDDDCKARIIRGGSYYNVSLAMRVNGRTLAVEQFRSRALGFRLAEDR